MGTHFRNMRLLGTLIVLIGCASSTRAVLSEPECGVSRYPDAGERDGSRFVVGGQDARIHEFPWQIMLTRLRDNGEYRHTCGGEILDENIIITAAHCVHQREAGLFQVVTGEYKPTDDNIERRIYNVTSIIEHEEYDPETIVNDIALLKVDGPMMLDDTAVPICLPEADYDYTRLQVTVSGWGALASAPPGEREFPDTLQFVNMPVTDQEICTIRYAGIENTTRFITDDMICAGRPYEDEFDACQGDSGGPLVHKGDDGKFSLVGVVSWGEGCASNYPGVYARAQYFLQWIDDHRYFF